VSVHGTALGLIPDRRGPQDPWSPKARGLDLEASTAVRLNHLPGLPGNGGLRDVDDGRVTHTPKSAGVVRRLAAAAKSGQTAGPLDYSAGRSVSLPASGWTRRRPRTQNTRRPLSSLTVAQGAGEDLNPSCLRASAALRHRSASFNAAQTPSQQENRTALDRPARRHR
jgi:hypothetical protein